MAKSKAKRSIGSAYVQVELSMKGITDSVNDALRKSLQGASKSPEIKKASGDLGETIAEGVEDSGVGKNVGDSLGKESGSGMSKGIGAAKGAIMGAVAALGIGSMIASQVGSAIENQKTSSKLTAALALTSEEKARIEGSISDLFTGAYGDSREELTESMNIIVGSIKGARQASREELTAMGKDVANLSATYGLETAEIAGSAQSFINNGLGSWSDFADLTAKAFANLGQAGATDYLDTIKEYSGDLKASGLDLEESFNVFNNAIKGGFYDTDKLNDLLREARIRALDGSLSSDENAALLKKFSIDPKAYAKAAREGGDAWQKAWQDAFSKIAKNSSKGSDALVPVVLGSVGEDLNTQFKAIDWETIDQNLGSVENNMLKIDEAINDNVATSMTTLKNSFTQLMQDAIGPMLAELTPIIQKTTQWIKENEGLAKVIMGTLVVAIGAVTAAVIANTIAMVANNIAMLASPVTWITLAVVALIAAVVLLATNWDTATEAAFNFFKSIESSEAWGHIVNIGNGIKDFFIGLFKVIVNAFIMTLNTPMYALNGIIMALNAVNVSIPSWVPEIGGSSWSMNIPMVPTIPLLATGGDVVGPTIAMLGEGGRPERVIDRGLGNENLLLQNRLLDKVTGEFGGGTVNNVNIVIHEGQDIDAETLARMVTEQLNWEEVR